MRILYLFIGAAIVSGCATVNKGTNDHFRIDTVPQGATATTSIETSKSRTNRRRGKSKTPIYEGCSPTPCAIQLPRQSEFVVKLTHEGYEPTEIFITNSSKKGSLTANMAVTTTSVGGNTAVGIGAFLATEFVALLPIEIFSFGAVTVPGTSTSAAIGAAVPPALALTGGMLLFDAASGANKNLFPNPVVLELAPKGVSTRKDPLVSFYREKVYAEAQVKKACSQRNNRTQTKITKACKDAKSTLREKKRPIDLAKKAVLRPKK